MQINTNSLPSNFSILTIILLFPCILIAQPRFKAGIIAGLTASQIDGDLSAGYNKLGLQGGLRVIGRLTERTDASLEFLFSQRGAQRELVQNRYGDPLYPIALNYVEIPVQWHYKDWLIEGDDESKNYYRVAIGAGLSYARLIGSRMKDGPENPFFGLVPDFIKKNDLSFVLGFNFFANRHLGFSVRYNRSIVYMYDPRDHQNPPYNRAWNGHCLYFQTVYLF
jgi:Outer membrane protein beta-barrel domain